MYDVNLFTDINECETMEDVCAEFVTCTNTQGGHSCECTQEDGTSCTATFGGKFEFYHRNNSM